MVPSDQRASRCREKYAEIVRRKGPAKLLNNGAAWRRQRRLLADSTRLRRHRRPLRPANLQRRHLTRAGTRHLRQESSSRAEIAVKQRAERVRTRTSGSPVRPDEPVSGELIPPYI